MRHKPTIRSPPPGADGAARRRRLPRVAQGQALGTLHLVFDFQPHFVRPRRDRPAPGDLGHRLAGPHPARPLQPHRRGARLLLWRPALPVRPGSGRAAPSTTRVNSPRGGCSGEVGQGRAQRLPATSAYSLVSSRATARAGRPARPGRLASVAVSRWAPPVVNSGAGLPGHPPLPARAAAPCRAGQKAEVDEARRINPLKSPAP